MNYGMPYAARKQHSLTRLSKGNVVASSDVYERVPMAASGAQEETTLVVNFGCDRSEHDFEPAASALPHGGSPAVESNRTPAPSAVLSPPFAATPTNEAEQTRQRYIAALRAHDWEFDYSDDHAVWQRGFNERSRLTRLQREIDPLFALWNTHAPAGYQTRGVAA